MFSSLDLCCGLLGHLKPAGKTRRQWPPDLQQDKHSHTWSLGGKERPSDDLLVLRRKDWASFWGCRAFVVSESTLKRRFWKVFRDKMAKGRSEKCLKHSCLDWCGYSSLAAGATGQASDSRCQVSWRSCDSLRPPSLFSFVHIVLQFHHPALLSKNHTRRTVHDREHILPCCERLIENPWDLVLLAFGPLLSSCLRLSPGWASVCNIHR